MQGGWEAIDAGWVGNYRKGELPPENSSFHFETSRRENAGVGALIPLLYPSVLQLSFYPGEKE